MDPHKLQVILKKHKAWLRNNKDGKKANLRSADLSSADLRFANLSFADLRFANLSSANLGYVNLHSADLHSANLRFANLSSADLSSADLSSADLRSADLGYANLGYANLHSANLRSADLGYANLGYANLHSANLRSADLRSANLRHAKNISELQKIRTQICPQSGSFTAFKKLNGGIVAKLQIPASAKRSNAPGGRKCRASTARVISFIDSEETEAYSQYARDFIYRVGETVTPEKKFCENFSEECTSGIHFYLSKEEAEAP